MTGVRRALAFSFGERYTNAIINLVTMAIVSRLLTPEEVGVYMVASAVVMMIETFREFGISSYLIQARHLTTAGTRTAFTVTLLASLLFAVALVALAPSIAGFYAQPGLTAVLQIAAAGFVVAALAGPIMALMRRDMAFDKTAMINVIACAVNSVTMIVLALLGFSFMSLAWASLASSLALSIAAIACRPDLLLFRPSFGDWRAVVSFGGFSSATLLLNSLYMQLPQLILGRIVGFDAVGLYTRATMLCQLPERLLLNALHPVILPALSAQARAGGDLRQSYLHGLAHVSALQWPILITITLLADPFVRLLLGSEWMEAVPLVRIMALAALSMFPAFLTYPTLVACGGVEDTLKAALISLPPSMILICGAAFLGVEAVAASLFLTMPLQVYVALRFIRKRIGFAWPAFFASVAPSAVVTLCSTIAPALTIAFAGFRLDLTWSQTAIAVLGTLVGWLAGIWLARHPLRHEIVRAAGMARSLGGITASRLRRAVAG